MKKLYVIFYVVLFIILFLAANVIYGSGGIYFFKNLLFAAVAVVIAFFIHNYSINEDEKETLMLIEREKENIKKGEVSEENPFKPIITPLLNCILHIRDIEKKIREYSSQIFQSLKKIEISNKDEEDAINGIAKNIENINLSLRHFTEKIEVLSASIEESSSSTLELGASIEEVSESVSKLFSYIDETSTAIFELTAISKQLSSNLENLKKVTEDTNSAMSEMEASIKEVEVKALESAKFTEDMERDAQLGKEAINATENSMNKIKESNNLSYTALNELSVDIKSVSKILKVIEDIAEETALLALNAAIIAAQSGEQGKSFSVVAEEIKELAERTGVSTKEITSIIQNILVKSDKASSAINQSTKIIQEGVELTSQTGEIFKKILNSIEMADERVREIAKANIEQSKGITHIAKSTLQINQMVADFTRAMTEQRRGAEQIIIATEKVKEIANFSKNSTAEQAKTSKQIGKLVVEINEMSKYFKEQIMQFRKDFEELSKRIVVIRPNSTNINVALEDLNLSLKGVEAELNNLNKLRKGVNGSNS